VFELFDALQQNQVVDTLFVVNCNINTEAGKKLAGMIKNTDI